jgi:Recombination endonuclease VII
MDQDLYNEPIGDLPLEKPKKRRKYRKYPTPQCTPEERAALLEFQEGRCAICGRDDVELHLDHSGRNGRTRGYLCRAHNAALGMFHDSAKLLRAALCYLKDTPYQRMQKKKGEQRVTVEVG